MININKNEVNIEDTMFSNYILKNFDFPLLNLQIKNEIEIETILKEKYLDLKEYKFNNHYDYFHYLENNKFFIVIKKDINNLIIDVYSKNLKDIEDFYKNIETHIKKNSKNSMILHKLFYNTKGFIIKKKEIENSQINHINEKYYPYIKNIDNLFQNFIISNEQIIFINGDNGTGKTKFSTLFLNYLSNNIEKNINIISIDNINLIDKDEFWLYIEDKDIDLIILDDIEGIEDNKEFTNKILNFTDGILKNTTKIIISGAKLNFNNLNKGFRDNRVFKFLTFRDLTSEEAKKIWLNEDLTEENFDKIFIDKNKKIAKSLLSKKIFEEKNILNDYKINKDIEKLKENNKIGFFN